MNCHTVEPSCKNCDFCCLNFCCCCCFNLSFVCTSVKSKENCAFSLPTWQFFYFDVLTDFHYFPLDSSYARAVDVQHRFNPDLIPKIISELKSIRDASDEFWKSAHLLVSGWFESPLLSVHRSLQDLDQMILDDLNSAFWWVLVVLPWLHSKCREMS